MRIAFAGFVIECVSFIEKQVTLEEFAAGTTQSDAILDQYRGTNTVPGGVIEACEARADIDLVPLIYAYEGALGPVEDAVAEHYADAIAAALREAGPLGGVVLHLHGAAVSPAHVSVEALILERVRAVLPPGMPLVAAFDYHGNLGAAVLDRLDGAVAYHLSPHTDMGETGTRAMRWLMALIEGQPVGLAWAKPLVAVPSIASATTLEPLAGLLREARAEEARLGGAVDISLMAGFSYADTPDTGFTAVVTGTVPPADLAALAKAFSQRIHALRHALYGAAPVLPVAEAVHQAAERAATASRPVVLLEHADRMTDSTHVLAEVLRQGVRGVAVPYLWDPQAAAAAHQAGAGTTVTLQIGGWTSSRAGPRLALACKVLRSGPTSYRITGPMKRGHLVDLGLCALVETAGLVISLTSHAEVAIDEDCFKQFGLSAQDFAVIVLRSKTHFRAVFETLAEAIIIADSPDWGTADLPSLPYERLDRRRVFPFTETA